MAFSRNSIENKKCKLPFSFRKNGFGTYRFFFTGYEKYTNTARAFFLEVCMLNQGIASDAPVLGFASRIKFDEAELQYALAGTDAAKSLMSEQLVQPSYAVMRVGCFGHGAKQMCDYYSASKVKFSMIPFEINIGECVFAKNNLTGKVFCEKEIAFEHPEYFCQSGSASWDLKYIIKYDGYKGGYNGKDAKWFPIGMAAYFSGAITFDGIEYTVTGEKSHGYIDFAAGKTYPLPLMHLASSNLTSLITGKKLSDSCFAAHGSYDEKISVLLRLDLLGINFFAEKSGRKFSNKWKCMIMPDETDGEKLHWSASVSDKNWILDIDVFCPSADLFVREFELPEGERKTAKVLCGGTASGEVRLYKQIRKTIELIEHVHVENVLCEYGLEEAKSTEESE